MAKCGKCAEDVVAKDLLMCVECKSSFHFLCTRVASSEAFKKLKAGRKTSTWACDECHSESLSNASAASKNDPETGDSKVLQCLRAMQESMSAQFQTVHAQFETVNANMDGVKTQLTHIETTMEGLKLNIEALQAENRTLKDNVKRLSEENEATKEELGDLKNKLGDLQQYTRRNNLEIVGVPLSQGEDVYFLLERLAAYINVRFVREQISIAHRLPTRKTPRGPHQNHPQANIVVSFISRSAKEEWYAAAKARKELRACELHDSFPATKMFINHHLTPFNKVILGRAQRYKREGKLVAAWSTDTRVLVRVTASSPPQRVTTPEELDALLH